MLTPFGPLDQLDLKNPATSQEILSFDKHQVADGMVVESLFDQLIEIVPKNIKNAEVLLLDVETFITREPDDFNNATAFVWERTQNKPGIGRYLLALERKFNVVLLRFDESKKVFNACHISQGRRAGVWRVLEDFMVVLGKQIIHHYEVSESVKDKEIQMQAFWGYLKDIHGVDHAKKIALPRLLVNWGIYPWFKSVWNIDRVVIVGDEIWTLEVKHKYPYERIGCLYFGLNVGEAYVIRDLIGCGIKVSHMIVVKPQWCEGVSSTRMLSNFEVKKRALVIGAVWGRREISNILNRPSEASGGKTTMRGTGSIKFKPIAINEFSIISSLAESERGALSISNLFQGFTGQLCTEEFLRDLRMAEG